ncbi:MAG: hypothetical protein DRZ82_07845 [Thermoprotei archaeon]|nr:MAG: hypothetical protein DRZ82_07845 [Thermoprotei archaeon]
MDTSFDIPYEFLKLSKQALKESRRLLIPTIGSDDGVVLYAIAYLYSAMKKGVIAVDLGAGAGYSTIWIAKGIDDGCSSESNVIAVERRKDRAIKAKEILSRLTLRRTAVRVLNQDAIDFLKEWIARGNPSIDIAFVDVDKFLYLDVFVLLERVMRREGIVLFHNAYFSSVRKLIGYLKEHNYDHTVIPTSEGIVMIVMR